MSHLSCPPTGFQRRGRRRPNCLPNVQWRIGLTMTSKIENELTKATKLKRKNREDSQAWYARLTGKVGELENDDWESLSEAAQTWSNTATRAVNASATIEGSPDDTDAEPVEEPEEEKPAPKKNGKKSKAKAKADPEPEPEDDDEYEPTVEDEPEDDDE